MDQGNAALQLAPQNLQTSAAGWQTMKEQAHVMLRSGFLPPSIKTAEQCLAIFMTGRELGIGMMESMRSINVIQGKPTVSPQLMLALANRTGEIEDQEINADPDGATVTIKRRGRKAHKEHFGIKEAEAMGLLTKDNYRKQPATMFKWRALAANLRVTFPDVLLGLYTPEELGAEVAVNDEGEMSVAHAAAIEASAPTVKAVEAQKPAPKEEASGSGSGDFVTSRFTVSEPVTAKSGKTFWRVMDSNQKRYQIWESDVVSDLQMIGNQEVTVEVKTDDKGYSKIIGVVKDGNEPEVNYPDHLSKIVEGK